MKGYVGQKFVVEIEEILEGPSKKPLYRMKGFNSLVFDEIGLDILEPYIDRKDEGYLEGARDVRNYYENKAKEDNNND